MSYAILRSLCRMHTILVANTHFFLWPSFKTYHLTVYNKIQNRFPPLTDRGTAVLRNNTCVDAVELFDRASLSECEKDEDMFRLVPDIKGADPMAAALLIECRGETPEALQCRIDEV